ncbi:hypothetical protein [Streptomyces sp. 891-h]|uniref:hypothetical protein n=1 Tax=Streptomyces sp. 891-h TaxID=2720714 RepID=UPI001FAA397F|nr:hypothetical protein [Streptomyces sp. 891-h]UNZ17805.1 hypothetical protein HC362_12780 [Streptomyces sp. 891-h]
MTAGYVFVLVLLGFFLACCAWALPAERRSRAAQRRVREKERAQAEQLGWRPLAECSVPVPRVVAVAARRSELAMVKRVRGAEVWVIWHHCWTSRGMGDNYLVNETRYFTAVPPGVPDVTERRARTLRLTRPVPMNPRARRSIPGGRPSRWLIKKGILVLRFGASFDYNRADSQARQAREFARLLPDYMP